MSARVFLDTNVFVYTFDQRDRVKRDKARGLVEAALHDQSGIISFQVVQEFINVATRKFATPLSDGDCLVYMQQVLAPLCEVQSSIELYEEALDIKERWKFSFFDSLIVAAARVGGCEVLYTEDLQHGQKIRNVTVVDPFLGSK